MQIWKVYGRKSKENKTHVVQEAHEYIEKLLVFYRPER